VIFGSNDLKRLYTDFGDEVKFNLNPLVFGSRDSLSCFDEASPCKLEQYSMCVVDNYEQSQYMPWLSCMDGNGDPTQQCDKENNISDADMQTCLADNDAIIDKYLARDKGISSAPTVHVNGKEVTAEYGAISSALCSAKPDLAGCSKAANFAIVA
jgi:hypothetical protein